MFASWLRPGSRLHDESQSRLHGELESRLGGLVKRFIRGATNVHHGREYHSHVTLLHQVATLRCASSVWRPVQPQCSKPRTEIKIMPEALLRCLALN